jgi:hypothetical protein
MMSPVRSEKEHFPDPGALNMWVVLHPEAYLPVSIWCLEK